MPSFDLTVQPWIPVRHRDGEDGPGETGLLGVLREAHELADIAVPAVPAAAGLWRVLCLIAGRVTGLDDPGGGPAEWAARRDGVLAGGRFAPGSAEDYLAGPGRCFDLFDAERPWLQEPRLATECAKDTGINKLVFGRPSGNNLVWFRHHTDQDPQPVRAAEAAWYLLAWMYAGPAGKITPRASGGRVESNMTAGPLRSRLMFHPLGASVFESLVLGIPFPGPLEGRPDPDLAPWEGPEPRDPLGPPPLPGGLAGRLAGQFRHAVLLQPSPDGACAVNARITWAHREAGVPVRDPYMIYDTPKNGAAPYARYAKSGLPAWASLGGVVAPGEGSSRPAVFGQLPAGARVRARAYGLDQDGQPSERQWTAEVTPPLPPAAGPGAGPAFSGGEEYAAVIAAAEETAYTLRQALRRAYGSLSGPPSGRRTSDGPWPAAAAARYWEAAGRAYPGLAAGPPDPDAAAAVFTAAALSAWDSTAGPYALAGPRAAAVIARARARLAAGMPGADTGRTPVTTDVPVPAAADRLARDLAALTPLDRAFITRGLGLPPEQYAPQAQRVIAPHVPADAGRAVERAYYTAASLTAAVRPGPGTISGASAQRPSLGWTLGRAAARGIRDCEDTLMMLAGQDAAGVHRLAARRVPAVLPAGTRLDCGALVRDLIRWDTEARLVAAEWLRDFYQASARRGGAAPTTEETAS